MRSVLPLAAISLVAAGCAKSVPVAEGECSDLLLQAFPATSFESEEEEEALQSILLGIHEQCMGTLDQSAKDRAINPGALLDIDGLPQPEGTNLADQTPIGLSGRSRHPIAKHLEAMADENQNCLGSDSTRFSNRAFTSGGDCFFDKTCTKAESTGRTFTKNILAKVWTDSFADYYHTTVPFEDGDVDAIVSRGWIAESFKSGQDGDGKSEWKQRYVLDIFYVDPSDDSKTMRYYMYWSEAAIAGVGEDLYVSAVRDGLEENYENVDVFFDGEVCDDRDMTEDEAKEL